MLQYLDDYPIYESYLNGKIDKGSGINVKWETMVNSIYEIAKNNILIHKPLIINIGFDCINDVQEKVHVMHSVLAYLYSEDKEKYSLRVYDPSVPWMISQIYIMKDTKEVGFKGGWSPLDGKEYCKVDYLSYVSLDDLVEYNLDNHSTKWAKDNIQYEHSFLYFGINDKVIVRNEQGEYIESALL